MLPCNVIVRQDDDGVRVACMDPAAVLSLVDAPEVAELAAEVRKRLEHVVGARSAEESEPGILGRYRFHDASP